MSGETLTDRNASRREAVELGEPGAHGEALELDADLGAVRLGEPHVRAGVRVAREARERLVAVRVLVGEPDDRLQLASRRRPAASTEASRSKRWREGRPSRVAGGARTTSRMQPSARLG